MASENKSVRIAVVGMGIGRPNGELHSRTTHAATVVALCDLLRRPDESLRQRLTGRSQILYRLQRDVQSH